MVTSKVTVNNKSFSIFFIILIWFFSPNFLFVFFDFSSTGIGLMIAGLLLIFTYIIKVNKIDIPYSTFIIIPIFINITLSFIFINSEIDIRQLQSIFGILILMIAASNLLNYLGELSPRELIGPVRFLIICLIVIGFVGCFIPMDSGLWSREGHTTFPFSEHSQYALCFGAIFFIAIPLLPKKELICYCIIGIFYALKLPSFTLLLICLSSIFIISKKIIFYTMLILTLILINNDIGLYFIDRVVNNTGYNLTNLVYLQGLESIYLSNNYTNGLGIGFQRMGEEPSGKYYNIITSFGSPLNRNDGGFVASKLLAEFGAIGFIIISYIIFYIYSSYKIIEQRSACSVKSIFGYRNRFPESIVLFSSFEIFIRGTGYFSPTIILMLAILCNHFFSSNFKFRV